MSARSAGRIAALVTARTLGVHTRPTVQSDPRLEVPPVGGPVSETPTASSGTGAAMPLIPPTEPGAVVSSGETSALQTLVSYIPSEALTIYLAGLAAVNLVQDPNTAEQKTAAVWVLFVIAAFANAGFLWVAFRNKFREFSRRELTVRQTRPLVAALIITELALFVYALAVPTGIAISDRPWLPLILLVGAAITIGFARLFGLGPLRDDEEG